MVDRKLANFVFVAILGSWVAWISQPAGNAAPDPIARTLASHCEDDFKLNDEYVNFSKLSAANHENVDYRITVLNRHALVTILVPHGGMEIGTAEIGDAVAGAKLNLYKFEGIRPSENFKLHITSTHFDEPKALALVGDSEYAVSIHGFKDDAHSSIEVGGSNLSLRQAFVDKIKVLKLPFETDTQVSRFPGIDPKNIVNRAKKGGLQIEISSALRKSLIAQPALLAQFARAVQNAVATVSK